MYRWQSPGGITVSFVEVEPGVNLFYEIRGDGPTVLFVHGWTMSHDVWEYQVSALAKRYRTVVLDLRGHGDSDKPWGDYTYEKYVSDIKVVVDTLKLDDFTFVGWSMGGAIGLVYLLHGGTGIRKFVSVDGVIPYFTARPQLPFGPTRQQVNEWLEEERTDRPDFTKGFVDSMFYQRGQKYTKLWIWNITMKASWHVAIQSLKLLRDTDFDNVLDKVNVPVAVFHGLHDKVVPIQFGQYAAARIPGANLTTFTQSGHAPFIEEPQAFNRALINLMEH